MRFLKDDDYKSFITTDDLEAMLDEMVEDAFTRDELLKCEVIAQDEIASYLRNRYDIEATFAPAVEGEPDARSPIMIMYMIDVSLFHLGTRLPGRMNLEQRQARYELALMWLDKVNKGKLQPALPLIEESDPGNPVKWGSTTKTDNEW